MKRLSCALFILLVVIQLIAADDIKLGVFPHGQWLDTQWKAYWTFGDDSITLRDVNDKEIYNFEGIVQNFVVTELPRGGVRLTFDCAKARRSYLFERTTAGAPMQMQIRQQGSSVAYKAKMPTVSEQQLDTYKEAVIAGKTAEVAKVVAAIEAVSVDPTAAKQAEADKAAALAAKQAEALEQRRIQALAQAQTSDFAALEKSVDDAVAAGQGDQLLQVLEAEAAKPDAPPSVFIALSVLYGRKGLKTQSYAALELAEKAPVPPGVSFNVALVYGRKQLLAGAPDAKSFMVGDVVLVPTPPEARVFLDGEDKGTGPMTLAKIAAGSHTLKLTAEGYRDYEAPMEIGVGQSQQVAAALVALPSYFALEFDNNWNTDILIDGKYAGHLSPFEVSPGDHHIEVNNPNYFPKAETISFKPGQTVSRQWSLEPRTLLWDITSEPVGASVRLDGK